MPKTQPRGQKRIHSYLDIVDAILYVLCEGIAWRAMPHDLPPWQTVYSYSRDWSMDGTWKWIHDVLRAGDRRRVGRDPEPRGGIIDSIGAHLGKRGARGYDGAKKIEGRKRHLLVDTEGRLIEVFVHDADIQDPDEDREVLVFAKAEHPRLEKVWADGRYQGYFVDWAAEKLQIAVEVVHKLDNQVDFVVLVH